MKPEKHHPLVSVRVFVVVLTKGHTKFHLHPRLYLRPHQVEAAAQRLRKHNKDAKVNVIQAFIPLPPHIMNEERLSEWVYFGSPRSKKEIAEAKRAAMQKQKRLEKPCVK